MEYVFGALSALLFLCALKVLLRLRALRATHVTDLPTKRAFRHFVAVAPRRVLVLGTSADNSVSGTVVDVLDRLPYFTVTNRPKRSWYARVGRNAKGEIVVK